jgi:hypothetical protein
MLVAVYAFSVGCSTKGGGGDSSVCDQYLDCLEAVAASNGGSSSELAGAEQLYGKNGGCNSSVQARALCDSACTQAQSEAALAYPKVAACGGGGNTETGPSSVVTGSQHSRSSSHTITLPTSATDAALDLNGDGKPDDQLGSIIGALAAVMLDPQAAIDASTTSGAVLMLFDEVSTDATQQNAQHAGITLQIANQPATPPSYDGSDTFTANLEYVPAQFFGGITSGVFTSNPPATAMTPVTFTLLLPLVLGQPPLILPITAGALSYSDVGGVLTGQLNGAIKQTDVDNTIIPAVATLLNNELHMPNPSPEIAAFDTNGDGTITAAEVMNNPIISSVIKADVQLFQNGTYDPNPANTAPDSLSIGLKLTAVQATF